MGTFDRKAAADALAARTQESFASREGDRMFTGMFRDDLGFQIPTWKITEGNHWFDVIPYTSGDQDPRHPAGTPCYFLEVHVHTNVGPREQSFVCPSFNYKKPCPICEHRQTLRDQAPDGGPEKEAHDKMVKDLMPRRRCLYNVVVYTKERGELKVVPAQGGEEVRVLDVAHWNMETHLVLLANRERAEGGAAVVFADPDEGKRIVFTRVGSGATNTRYTGHAFEERGYAIPNEWLEAAFTLDELLQLPEYDEIAAAFFGGAGQAPAAAPAATKVPARGSVPVGGAARPAPSTGARPIPLRRPAPAAEQAPEEEPAEEDQNDQPQPPARRAKVPVPAASPAPRGLTRVAPAAQASSQEQVCPEPTGTFGADTDQFDKCQTCDLWEPCAQTKTRAMAAERKAQPAAAPGRRPAPRK